MASQTNSSTSGYPTPPSPSDSRRPWWSRPIATLPPINNRKPTCKDHTMLLTPLCGGFFTVLAVFLILLVIDLTQPHAKISIQSMAVSPSAAACHVDFLVENPSSRYSVYYEGDDASVTLGHENVAVFNITRKRNYKDHHHHTAAFSLAFHAEEVNRTDVVSQELHIKLRGKHKRYVDYEEAGHFDIRCQILTPCHDHNTDKIKCHSSFAPLELLF